MILYKLNESKTIDDTGRPHIVYGVDVFQHIDSVTDAFTDKDSAEHFVALCNQLDLAPVHLRDALENALANDK